MRALSLILTSLICSLAFGDSAPLSEASGPALLHPTVDEQPERLYLAGGKKQGAARSNLWAVTPFITDIKHQRQRNLCTIFVMNALFETAYLQANRSTTDADLSEEWLQYLNSLVSESGGGEGSFMARNFSLAKKYGVAGESRMPYDGELWKEDHPKAKDYCQDLSGMNLKRCLNGHRSPLLFSKSKEELTNSNSSFYDPDFAEARDHAKQVRSVLELDGKFIASTSEIKSLLDQGITLSMEIDIFYESWNHSRANALGMIADNKLWKLGIVGYPEPGSVDRAVSPTEPARHAVQIVGYDDDYEVTYKKKMLDGSVQTFTRRGVYIFKNSWGTQDFGSRFSYDKKTVRGFGMIVQDHAHEEGQFFALDAAGI